MKMSAPYTKLEKPLNESALLCRACLAKSGEMKNMLDWGLAEDFSKITEIQLLQSANMSTLLCVSCEDTLLTCQRFKQQCQNSDYVLKKMCKQEDETEVFIKREKDINIINMPKENLVETKLLSDNLILKITAPDMAEKVHLPCLYCQQNFLKQKDLLLHLKRQHQAGPNFLVSLQYYCSEPDCLYNKEAAKNKFFLGRKYLNQHYIKVHASREFLCDKCNTKFSTDSELNRHLKTCSVTFPCELCDLIYKTKERLHVHIMRKHPEIHQEYKNRKKENLLKRKSAIETDVKRLRKHGNTGLGGSPKKTLATQTFNNSDDDIRNDISLASWYSKTDTESTKRDEISTQTVFEDILSIKSQNSEDESIFFSETVSLSDIQTQTFPLEFGLSRSDKETITAGTQSPDLSIKETQTCLCLYDSPKINFKLFDSVSSSPGSMNFTSTETQTQEHRSTVKSDVMLGFSSAETQTSFEEDL